ncbi:asialoglycoprotein receptor 1-like [Labeo rohita]|uniref:asialoglycoprotein receptor 1-like n=1 Tax=Labeo rohita TaxID=84645 RepID=UPI0021E2B07E|nr:asialoglycoprotein receptor 1-like [Labeo rohita]
MDCSEEYIRMEMECEPKKSFWRDRPCSRQTGILVLLGTVCMVIFMVMTFVIFSHQEEKFSMLESWMKSQSSDLTSVAFKQEENLQKLEHQQNVSHTEVKSLMDSLSSAVSDLRNNLTVHSSRSFQHTQQILMDISRSLINLLHYVGETGSSIQLLSYKLSFTNLLTTGCTDPDWIPFSNSCYLFSRNILNWTEAKDYCAKQGALLLKIEDASEKEWKFVTNMARPQQYWIGLTDQNTGQWRWADDTPYTMNKVQWVPGQPDNWTGHGLGEEGEDCGHLTVYGLLNDAHCSYKIKYICKMKK